MAGIWAALSAIAFVYLLLQQLLKNLSMKKKSPPSPFGLPIIGHLHLLGKNPHQDLHRLARKHGPIMGFRLGFVPAVVVSSPAAAELILKTHDAVFASRPKIIAVDSVSYEQRNLVFAAHGPYWRNMRRLCTSELLNAARIAQFQAARRAEVRLLVTSLKSAAELGEIVDLSARVTGLSADMNCVMVFGRKYDDSDLGEMGFKSVFMETAEISAKFNLADYFPFIGALDLQGLNSRIKELGKVFDGFLEKIIDDHLQEKPEKKETKDFVDTMMAVMNSGEAGFEFDRRHVKAVLQDMLIAGTDTSSTSVEWAISELIRHPSIMKKLQKELESTVGLNHMVEESHLEKLEYLDFVVKETLRLHPPAPLLIPRESMEDCTINGIFHIPKKSRAIVNVWAIGRDPSAWANPETFWPERFAGSDVDSRGRDFQLIPFGSGRRSCPGQQLGLTVVKLMLAQLVHCFDWELPNGMLPSDLDMSEHFGVVMSRAEHLMLIPKYRLIA
ncbi:hypothetical protein ABFS82_12G008000 [Erythranthe guttata]|uniref:Cytochrome P450 n=1 Tax=Erythranthe guttata TaxID=4155 RepID=A0A022QC13_ERYGU|nr:PREDICTED: cytochrome P450 CYP736A12-like [Erythranthe guttata]EYU24035.1 hypothetical protein MIMGU_mgv1a020942mg [Erythranthe guttata]|eukprot:XP_012853578.1 PREDICTED: cytochrome P450 CYP736A12-like [Erythranthe guttata]